MPQQVTKVRVFVASPGDVQAEVDSLPRVIEELNITLGENLHFVVELVRWETHCQPAMGRPQGIINEQIGEYDVFIGIMWKRFGSPTGLAESGTKEEFDLAYEEWKRDNKLQIAFYFCQAEYRLNSTVESEQVGRVLDFQTELGKKGLVWPYPNADSFAGVIRPHLSRILFKMFPPTYQASAEIINRPVPTTESPNEQIEQAADSTFENAGRQPGSQQIVESLQALEQSANQEDFARSTRFSGDLDDFHLLRLQLVTCTWLEAQIPSSMLNTHEANRLYLYKERLCPTVPEWVSLLRMLINDFHGYVPGWYWFKGSWNVETLVLNLAFSDPHDAVRQRAFTLLATARVPLPDGVQESMAWTITSDSSPDVRRAALSLIGSSGGPEYLPIIGSALVDRESQVLSQAKMSEYLVLARTEPDRALSKLLDETSIRTEDVLDELRSSIGGIATATLLRALDHPNDEIRFFAIKELTARAELTVELAVSRKEDKYDPIKAAAYRFLIEQGAEIDEEDFAWKVPHDYFRRFAGRNLITRPAPPIDREQIVLEFYRRYGADELVGMVAWDRLAGHEAYRSLAIDHFPEFAQRIREDLRTDFAVAAEAYHRIQLGEWRRIGATPSSPENIHLLMPPSLSRLSWRKHEVTERESPTAESLAQDDVAGRRVYYLAAALAGLARHALPEDAELGRRFLSHKDNDVRIEAVKVIARCGNAADVPVLIEIAKTTDGLLQELAATTALKLAEYLETAGEFLGTGNEILVSIAVAELIAREDKEEARVFLRPYLYNDNEKIRSRVMAFFALTCDEQLLENLLSQYTSEPVYYYDVVSCLDRMLYSPHHLRSAYKKSIESSLFGFLAFES